MIPATFRIEREDGEVVWEGSVQPTMIEHGNPPRWSYALDGLPVMKNGDKLITTYEYAKVDA